MSCSIRLGSRNAKGNYTELLLTYKEGVVAAYTKSDIAWRAEGGAVVVAAYIQLGTSWGGERGRGLGVRGVCLGTWAEYGRIISLRTTKGTGRTLH